MNEELAASPWQGGGLGGWCGRQDLRHVPQELLVHEAKVGEAHVPPLLDVIEGILQAELLALH